MIHPDFADDVAVRPRLSTPPAARALAGSSLAVFALLFGAVFLAACGDTPESAEDFAVIQPNATPVEVVALEPTLFEDVVELTGTVDAGEDATLSPSASGTLTYVAPVGTRVRRGQTVAQINAGTQQAGIAQARGQLAQSAASVEQAEAAIRAARARREAAQSQLELAQDQYDRQRPLLEQQIISPLEFQNVESQLASARASVAEAEAGIAQAQGQLAAARGGLAAGQAGVESARSQLANTRITAPFSGVVEARLMEPGELASPGQPVVRLVGGGGLRVEAGVPERYAGEIEVGTQVTVNPTAYTAEARGGRVVFVGAAINPESRTFPIEVTVDNSDGALRTDMVVQMSVTRSVITDALVLPQDAVVRDERGTSVFVVAETDSASVARRRSVELGASSGGRVVVASGLESGDRVVVSGQGELADGDPVRVERTRSGRAQAALRRPAGSAIDPSAPLAAVEPRR